MRKLMSTKFGKLATAFLCMALLVCMGVVNSFAAEGATPEDVSSVVNGVKGSFSTLSSTFSFANILSMIGIAIGAAAILTLGWFGLRKVVSMIQKALKRGRVSV